MDIGPRPEMLKRLPRGRHGLPRELVFRSQRERMLHATARAVSELSYPALTVSAILRRAGVSRKTFYEHFRDKETCFLAAYDSASTALVRGVAAAFSGPAPWREKVCRGLGEFLRLLSTEPAFARMCIVEVLSAGPAALARRDATMQALIAFIDEGRHETPSGRRPPRLVSESVVGSIYELVYARLMRGDHAELAELLPDLVYLTLAPYLGTDEAARAYRALSGGLRDRRCRAQASSEPGIRALPKA